jgi:GNAT superfamily N-acetyltransferase
MLRIERSSVRDIARLRDFDPMARQDADRRALLARWTAEGDVQIGMLDGDVVGFAVVTEHFFHQPFIELVMVGESHRRRGYGRALVGHCVDLFPGGKVWTSTNESNTPMQALLAQSGFSSSGRIDNLDPGDPELIFVHLPGA